MASIWEAPSNIVDIFERVRREHHERRLAKASLWYLVSDGPAVSRNQVVHTKVNRCTKPEKLASGHDFRIVVLAESWSHLTDAQREVVADEALCRCGVKYVPRMVEINGKEQPLKDEWGRVIHTDQISYDDEGVPKWVLNPPDAGLFYAVLRRHGEYREAAENVVRALAGEPLLGPANAPLFEDQDGDAGAASVDSLDNQVGEAVDSIEVERRAG